jgi:hypothetical protein
VGGIIEKTYLYEGGGGGNNRENLIWGWGNNREIIPPNPTLIFTLKFSIIPSTPILTPI